jgi:hypothetical protein
MARKDARARVAVAATPRARSARVTNDVVTLDAVLAGRQGPLASGPADSAFELFAFEQILKSNDLTDEELFDGQVGGGNDGGLDGLFTFLDGNLLRVDSETFDPAFQPASVKRGAELTLFAVQAKTTNSFGETAYEKAQATFEILLDLERTEAELRALFSEAVVERAQVFRQAFTVLASRHPRVLLKFAYATKGDTGTVDPKVLTRASELRDRLGSLIYGSVAETPLVGARELLDLNARQRPHALQLRYQDNLTSGNSHVAIVTLDDYFAFITDENQALRSYAFDWNVRDYEGDVEVNREIRESLQDAESPEFWWLNNGVTVLCSTATISGRTFSLDDVQIVNGLQTSVTIYDHLSSASGDDASRSRSLLVRIIVTEDPPTRDKVIRATNSQTSVSAASLRATDQVQRDLELFFSQRGWFYERRKNLYKNQGRNPERILSIPFMAQSMMAMGLSEPDNSRARPSSLIKRQADYERLFDPEVGYDIYLLAATTQRHVDAFLKSAGAGANAQERTNLRFHLSMLLVCSGLQDRIRHPSQLRPLLAAVPFSEAQMTTELGRLRGWFEEYREASGGDPDKIVKSREFVEFLFDRLFPPPALTGVALPEAAAATD